MKRLKIISDGSVQGTKIIDSEGNEIGPVEEITWSINADQWDKGARATVTFSEVGIEANLAKVSVTEEMLQMLAVAPGGRASVVEVTTERDREL